MTRNARATRDLAFLLLWWLACRLPFYRPRVDFFDSPEYLWRVRGGFWSGVRNAGGHIPFQGTLYGPAGFLYTLFGGALSEIECIAPLALLYGALAYLALIFLWRRFTPRPIFLTASALYPLLAGPALCDLSTYSTSATLASLFGGTALLAEGLARDRGPWRLPLRVGAAACFGFSVYTHLIAALWPCVPGAVVVAFVAGAPAMRTHRDLPPLRGRLTEALLWGLLVPAAAAALALVLAGHDIARAGLAPSAIAGMSKLILRDGGLHRLDPQRVIRSLREQGLLVTGGLGGFLAIAGLWRWTRREGRWAWVSAVLLLASFLLVGQEFVWGMPGRLYLPMTVFAVPAMAGAALWDGTRRRRWLSAAVALLLFAQTGATFLHVAVSRRLGPHPNEALLRGSAGLGHDDLLVVHPQNRTYSAIGSVLWDGDPRRLPALGAAWDEAELAGGRVWTSSEAIHFNALLYDGHLRSIRHWRSPENLTGLERYLSKSAALVLDAPLGRSEFMAEIMRPSAAPGWAERLRRAQVHLEPGGGLLVAAGEGPTPFLLRAYGNLGDCVSRERYDTFEVTAWAQAWQRGCDPLQRAAPDALGIAMAPIPARARYALLFGLDSARPIAAVLEERDFAPMDIATAAARLEGVRRPFAAVVLRTPNARQVNLAIRELAQPY